MIKNLLFFSLFILFSFSKSTIGTGLDADSNLVKIPLIKENMTKGDIRQIIGNPDKIENKMANGKKYLIWSYITKETTLGQRELLDENLTPIVFFNGRVIGKGRKFYNYLFNVNNIQEKVRQEKRQKYTNDRHEWPKNEHVIIPSPTEKKYYKEGEVDEKSNYNNIQDATNGESENANGVEEDIKKSLEDNNQNQE